MVAEKGTPMDEELVLLMESMMVGCWVALRDELKAIL
jgi:hypothetical protein